MPKPIKKLKPIPEFRSHEEAGEFWMTHDTTEYLDWSKARRVRFPKLRPSTTTISLRLPGNAGRAACPREPAGCAVSESPEGVPG
jgi:hypothetical protein